MSRNPNNLSQNIISTRHPFLSGCFRIILIFCLSILFSIQQQAAGTDSLRAALQGNLQDTSRIKLLIELGNALIDEGRYDEARNYFNESLNRSRKGRYAALEGRALKSIGVSYFYQGNNQQAMTNWELATTIAKRRGDMGEFYGIRMNMANVLLANGNHPAAQQAYYEALHWAETNHLGKEVAKCLINLASLHYSQERIDSSRHYVERALREHGDDMEPYIKANALNNLATIDSRELKVEDMERSAKALLEYSRKEGLNRFVGCAYEVLGIAAMTRGRHTEARNFMKNAIQIHSTDNDDRGKTSTLQRLAELDLHAVEKKDAAYLDQFFNGNRDRALSEAQKLLDTVIVFFRQQEETEQLCSAYESLSGVARAQGNPGAALEYYIRFKKLSDSLINAERDKRLTERAMTYAFNKKEAAMRAEQEKKNQRQRFIRNGIAGSLVFALLFLAVVWRQRNRINKEKKRSEELLLNILPEEVADELKENGATVARHFDRATVLFTDFKGFTQLSEKVTPAELVEELNNCFRAFDAIMDKYHIEKIKTIGDAYMAVGGVPDPRHGSPADVVRAALEMQNFMKAYNAGREALGKPWVEMRTGIHTGPVVAGIVGMRKFQYDIWGDTVNTASRMESSGEAGKVNISETTYELVKDRFTCIHRGKIQAKGKGELEMYFVAEIAAAGRKD